MNSLLEAYLDDELDPSRQALVRDHLETCPTCGATLAGLSRLRADLHEHLPYFRASDALRQRVLNSIPQDEEVPAPRSPRPSIFWSWKWIAIASAFALLISLGINLFFAVSTRNSHQELADEVLSGHIRSMLGSHPAEVLSSDRHTVKPWFSGKLDFSPDVKDLANEGYPLIGGRLDYIAERRVAALVFHRAQHTISLFEWPEGDTQSAQFSRNGLAVIAWSKDGLSYWAASDMAVPDLRQFANLYRKE